MKEFEVGDYIKCINPRWATLYGSVFEVSEKTVVDGIANYWIHGTTGTFNLHQNYIKDFVLTPTPTEVQNATTKGQGVTEPDTGVKHDSGKRQWWFMWQFLPELEQVVDILDYGNKKYPADDGSNWRKVDNAKNRYTSAAMRHWSAWLGGEKVDAETGKSHLAHMITNLLFLMWFERNAKL